MRRLYILALSLYLASCMVGPDYRRPAVEVPQSYRYGLEDARETANSAWWRQFGDPVLDDLIARALAGNKSVAIAAANIEQAAGVMTQVRSALFPQISYGAVASRQRFSEKNATPLSSSVPNPQEAFQLFAGASWELDLWGRIRRQSEASRADLLASVEARRGVILSLVASVADNYFLLRGLDEQLVIARRNLASYQDSVKLFELQFTYGQVSQMNVQQARTQYETAAATIPQIEKQIVLTENAISILLGRNPEPVPRGKSIYDLAVPPVPAGLPSQVLENRPDVLQAEQNLIAANARIGVARALYFPAISLTGEYGRSSGALRNLFRGPAEIWSYTGSLTGPIFTAGAVSGQVRQAEAAQQAALLAYQSAIQNAFADVEDSLVGRQKLADQLDAQGRLVVAAKEYERLARLQYDGGYTPYFTVLQAQQQLFPAELEWAQTRASLFSSLVGIYKALGGGWVNEADKLTNREQGQDKNATQGGEMKKLSTGGIR